MTLTDIGESRIRGYLFVLGRSLRSFLPADVAADAVREVESHIRERIEQVRPSDPRTSGPSDPRISGPSDPRTSGPSDPRTSGPSDPDERATVERILAELGPPLRVAQAYAQEMTLDEAETTGRFVPMLRAIWHLSTTSVYGFAWGILVLLGWAMGIALLATAVLKPIFPNNVGLILTSGAPAAGLHVMSVPRLSIGFSSLDHGLIYGALFPLPPGAVVYGGYWVIPISIVAGLLVLVVTHRLSRRMLGWLRSRRAPGRLRVRLVLE